MKASPASTLLNTDHPMQRIKKHPEPMAASARKISFRERYTPEALFPGISALGSSVNRDNLILTFLSRIFYIFSILFGIIFSSRLCKLFALWRSIWRGYGS